MDARASARARSAGRTGPGRGARRRRPGRRPARSAAPPRARWRRAPASSTAPTRSARIRKPPRPSSSRASCWTFSRSCERSTKTWATAKASSRVSEGSWPPAAHLLGPDLARDVDQKAAAVALAVDVAGPVKHLLKRGDRQLDRLVAGGRVTAHRGIDRTRVLVLDAGRRDDAGASGNSGEKRSGRPDPGSRDWGCAIRPPVSAPSSSGRATGFSGPGKYGAGPGGSGGVRGSFWDGGAQGLGAEPASRKPQFAEIGALPRRSRSYAAYRGTTTHFDF